MGIEYPRKFQIKSGYLTLLLGLIMEHLILQVSFIFEYLVKQIPRYLLHLCQHHFICQSIHTKLIESSMNLMELKL
jgi:hypothetical protein